MVILSAYIKVIQLWGRIIYFKKLRVDARGKYKHGSYDMHIDDIMAVHEEDGGHPLRVSSLPPPPPPQGMPHIFAHVFITI
jgi:hypothetical protein